ncbi:protein-L-histidine N-pros-methyltransferase-like [Palaemon carinicauda]|uniref:protein-L-histidine N-pros-methyltransferase-like n=1 Tax=Palaemon carinicauda TaxID=392227 RepID=UPI0035B5EA90
MNTCHTLQFCVVLVLFVFTAMAGANPRPYLRSNLARTVYDRMMTDERLRTMNLSKMYEVDELALEDDVRERFMQMSCDEDTQKFLDNCFEQSEWLITQIWHAAAKAFLGMFMTQTSVNG